MWHALFRPRDRGIYQPQAQGELDRLNEFPVMHRYYFDLSDQNGRFVDDEGMDFNDMDAVEREAAQAMADAARHSFQRPIKPAEIVIEVRDDAGPVMRVRLALEIERLKKQ